MESRPARKTRPSLAVEPLEDRRLLSLFTPALAREDFGRPLDSQVETAPLPGGPERGPFDPHESSGFGDTSGSDSGDPAPSGWAWMMPDPAPASMTPANGNGDEHQTELNHAAPADPSSIALDPTSSEVPANAPAPADHGVGGGAGLESAASLPVSPVGLTVLPLSLPSRSSAGVSIARSVPEPVQTTSIKSEASSEPSATGRSSADETLLAIASASSGAAGTSPGIEQARGLTSIILPIGPGLAVSQATPGLSLAPSKDQAGAAIPGEAPIGPGSDGGWSDARSSGTGAIVEARPGEAIALPEPELAGMIQGFLPFDRSSIEGAIDRILDPFDALGSSMPELRGPMGLITASLAAAATVVAVEVALRLRRSREQDLGSDDVESLTTFPGI